MTSTHASALCLCLTTDEDDCLPACLSVPLAHILPLTYYRLLQDFGVDIASGLPSERWEARRGRKQQKQKTAAILVCGIALPSLCRSSLPAARARRRPRRLLLAATVAPAPPAPVAVMRAPRALYCALLCCVARSLIHSFFKVRPREGTTNRCTLLGGATEPRPPSFVYICRSRRVTKQLKGKK